METWKVLAVDRKAVIKFKTEGKEVPGVRLLLQGAEPAFGADDRYIGFNWHDQFISYERVKKLGVEPMPGDVVQLYFNRYGDIEEIKIVPVEGK